MKAFGLELSLTRKALRNVVAFMGLALVLVGLAPSGFAAGDCEDNVGGTVEICHETSGGWVGSTMCIHAGGNALSECTTHPNEYVHTVQGATTTTSDALSILTSQTSVHGWPHSATSSTLTLSWYVSGDGYQTDDNTSECVEVTGYGSSSTYSITTTQTSQEVAVGGATCIFLLPLPIALTIPMAAVPALLHG